MIIYKTTNLINGLIYIGQKPTMETESELLNSKYYGSGTNINKAVKEYGKDNFKREVIDNSDDIYKLSEIEEMWISYYDATNSNIGYNIAKKSGKFFNYGNKMSKENLERISKKVYQYDLNGNFIAEYTSIRHAQRETNAKEIGKCCNGIYKKSGNFIWSFKLLNKVELNAKIFDLSCNNKGKECYMYDLFGKLIKEYKSYTIAQKENNLNNIWGKKENGYKFKGGYIWSFKLLSGEKLDFIIKEINNFIENNPIKRKMVAKYDKNNNLIKEYDSICGANLDTNIGFTAISNCAKGRSKSAGGFIWKFI